MKKILFAVLATVVLFSCEKNEDVTIPNNLLGEWFIHPEELKEEAEAETSSDKIVDMFEYAPFVLDWGTSETFAAMGDEGTQWGGKDLSALVTEIAIEGISDGLKAVKFLEEGKISATIIDEDGVESTATQDLATYEIVSESVVKIKINIEEEETPETKDEATGDLEDIINGLLENGIHVNYKITEGVLTFSLNQDFILPIIKQVVPIVALIPVPELEPDMSNMFEIMILQTVKAALSEKVVNSTTHFDVYMSVKNTPAK